MLSGGHTRTGVPLRVNVKVAVVIPVFFHSGALPSVLEGVKRYFPPDRILVVDDASPEASALVAEAMGVRSVSHRWNMGKGAALRHGIAYWKKRGMEWVITLDGDGQHSPDDLPGFIRRAKIGTDDLVIGSRTNNLSGMPWDRRFSNRSTSLLVSLLTGKRIEDLQCGFRLIRLNALEGIRFYSTGFEFESELVLKLARAGKNISFIQIKTIYSSSTKSSMKRLPDTIRFLKMVYDVTIRHD